MPDYPVIDTHVHTYRTAGTAIQAMGGSARAGYTGTIEELIPFMAQAGIEKVVMVNLTPVADMLEAARASLPKDLTPQQRQEEEKTIRQDMVGRVMRRNQWTCQVAQEHPGRLYPYIGIDPVMDGETMAQEIQERHSQGARGIKLHPVVQRFAINDRRLWPAYATAERLEMPMVIHTGPFEGLGGENARPSLFAEVARDFPRLVAVLAHCGGRPYFQEAIALAQQFPNVCFDCCGIVAGGPGPHDPPDEEIVALFRRLGVERVTFGSDWCFRDPIPDIQRVDGLSLTPQEKRLLLRENALRVLKL